jgi:putative transcriptional regulator
MKNNIRVARAIKDLTQSELADKIGVSRQTIYAIEQNKFVPSTLLALKLAQVLEKTVEELFSLTPED